MAQKGGTRLLYIGSTGSFSSRYAAHQLTATNNVRLHQFLRSYAANHPNDFTFNYKMLATCPKQCIYQAEHWVGECAGLGTAWDTLSMSGERLVLNRKRLGH
jgi:hypothetical protein